MPLPAPLARLSVPWLALLLFATGCESSPGTPRDTAELADAPDTSAGDVGEPADSATTDAVVGDADAAPSDGVDAGDVAGPCDFAPPPDFNDHTVLGFSRTDCVLAYAGTATVPLQLKFVIYDFTHDAAPRVHFLEPGFFALHDEWAWFRLLNGAAIPDWEQEPLAGFSFPTVAAIYAALAGKTDLPLDLRFIGTRIYSPAFYAQAGLSSTGPRFFGLGSLLFYPAQPDRAYPEAFWAFELEFVDRPSAAVVARFFALLSAALPADLAAQLKWLTRSPQQEEVGRELMAGGGPYADRILTYDDLVVSGEVVGYNSGVAAGFVRVFPEGDFTATDVGPNDLIVLARVPDDVPPVAAIISAVPQTALAHVNLLAKSRGTPNAYVGGILEWGQLDLWDYQHTPVAVKVTDDDVAWREIACHTEPVSPPGSGTRRVCPVWDAYVAARTTPLRTIAQVDLASAPLTVDVTDGDLADVAGVVPLVGGKCAGMLAFQSVAGMETPGTPLAITIKAFAEHLEPLRPTLEALLAQPLFRNDARVRFLTLEGEEEFREANAADVPALTWLTTFKVQHAADLFGQVLDGGGIVAMIRDRAIAPETLAALTAALNARFAWLAPTQGLRFRSSATAEDVVGFNGAGLYDSNTGFLRPELQPLADDRKKSVAWALKKTWASYWGFSAFEERSVANIDHLTGNMGVLVHPRFDDTLEEANGVMTFHLSRWFDPAVRRLVVNVQLGALSVTNPDGTLALPEIDEVVLGADGAVSIARVQGSTEVEAGTLLLSDAELTQLATDVAALADAWLDRPDPLVPAPERSRALVLDLEFKRVREGWPALASGEVLPARLIYKQVRVLDRAPVVETQADPWFGAPWTLASWLPRDLRTVARRVEAARCQSPWLDLRLYQVRTEAAYADLFPFTTAAHAYRVFLGFKGSAPGWTWPTNPYFIGAAALAAASYTPGGDLELVLEADNAAFFGVERVRFGADGSYALERGGEVLSGVLRDRAGQPIAPCSDLAPYASPTELLEALFTAP